jgi:formylmethanofuran dehydrogenase subunit E
MCAGLAIGIRAAESALAVLGADAAGNDLIVAVETDTCSVDAIQALTGATFGNGKLYYRDYAKNAYTFWRSGRAKGLRIVALPDDTDAAMPGFWEIFEKVQKGTATAEERAEFFAFQQERSQRILEADEDELFRIEEVADLPPARPLISAPVVCERCGEATMRPQEQAGTVVCVSCGQRAGQMIGAR